VQLARAAGYDPVRVTAQGLLSTPFAEVPLGPTWLTTPLARFACRVDAMVEDKVPTLVRWCGWNSVLLAQAGPELGG